MNKEFGRKISLLRKKKGLNQKEVCEKLGISQALLSHYEKGIRECGLSFLVKIADLYDVSVDYLLGRSPNSSALNEEPDVDNIEELNRLKGNTYCMLNRRLIINSTAVIYGMLAEINNKKLSKSVSDYLSVAQYNVFRKLYSLEEDKSDIFTLKTDSLDDYCNAYLALGNARINEIKQNGTIEGFDLSDDALAEKFSESYSPLNQMIKNAEKSLSQSFKI